MIRMTKGERKTIRDEFKLRLNQALFQTNFHRIYVAHHERFELETDKATKTTVFKALGVATVEGNALRWTVDAAHTGEYKNQRPVFKVLAIRFGNGIMGHHDLEAGATGDLIEIGPIFFRELFESFRNRLPALKQSLEQEKQDGIDSNKALSKIIYSAMSKCRPKALRYVSLFLPEGVTNELGKPYCAHLIFDYDGAPNSLHLKYTRVGRELEFDLEQATLDSAKGTSKVPVKVLPRTADNETVCAIRKAVSIIKLESKGIEMTTSNNGAGKQTVRAAAKKPAVKKAPAVKVAAETPTAKAPVAKKLPVVKRVAGETRAQQRDRALQAAADVFESKPVAKKPAAKKPAAKKPAPKTEHLKAFVEHANKVEAASTPKVKPAAIPRVWFSNNDDELRGLLDQQRVTANRIKLLTQAKANHTSPEVQTINNEQQAVRDTALLDAVKEIVKNYRAKVIKQRSVEGEPDTYKTIVKNHDGSATVCTITHDSSAEIPFILAVDIRWKGGDVSHRLPIALKNPNQLNTILKNQF